MRDIIRRNDIGDLEGFVSDLFRFPRFMSTGNAGIDEGTLALDISETDSEVIVRGSLPGFRKEDVDVEVHDGVLSIKATHEEETEEKNARYYDKMREDQEAHFQFVTALGEAFPGLYRPFVERHRDTPYTEAQRDFQCYRRSRYVEFNLVYDRGTLFGLQSGGRIESILMSMPPVAHWCYDWTPKPGTPEAELTDAYLKPQDWLPD